MLILCGFIMAFAHVYLPLCVGGENTLMVIIGEVGYILVNGKVML